MSKPHFLSLLCEAMSVSMTLRQKRVPRGKFHLAHAIAALVLSTTLTAQVSAQDTDGDGIPDAAEATYGTDPLKADTDDDGAGDWYEVFVSFTNPTDPASKPNVPYPLPKPDNSTGATNKPVKVFILAGQSNMVGMGDMNPITANGTLSKIVKTENKFPNLLDAGGVNWSVRKDVQYRGLISAIAKANLTVGQGSSTSTIGPELGMGHVMGYHLDEPVLIIKAAQGNRSLGWDFLPPGSPRSTAGSTTWAGYGDSSPSWTGNPPGPPGSGQSYAGWQYDQSFLHFDDWYGPGSTADVVSVADVLDNWATEYPQWAAQGFEIGGFAWFQGWNDGLSYNTQYADRYETNLVQLIKQLRTYYEGRYPGKIQANAPFVVATCGFSGFAATGNRLKVANAQLAVGNPTKYPEFAGNVKSMETRGYWRTREQSNSKQDYHYWRNAETFMLVGDALGRGMIDLLGASTPQPNVWSQTAGGAQNWTTALNWQDGAIPNPTNTTTMDFSSVNILADTTLNLGANRTARIWKFGDTSGTQNWIVSAGHTITLAGTTPTIDVTNNTTRLDNVVVGTDGLTKTGAGNLTLTVNNTYTGDTTISAGTLQLGNGGSTGSLATTGTLTNHAALVFNRSNDVIQGTDFAAAIAGTGTLTKLGTGILTLSGSNSYSGQTSISAGTLKLTHPAAVQNSSLVSVGNNTLQIATSAGISSSGNVSINGGTITLAQPSPAPGLTHAFGQLAFAHNTQNFTSSNVTDGNATLTFSSASVASGSGGTGTLNPTGVHLVIGSFAGGNTGTSTLSLGGTTTLNRIDGVIENGARTTQNILKSNTSTWTLAGTNTYSGTTTVTGGLLITTKAGALPGFNTAARVVFNGGTLGAQVGDNGWTTTEIDTLLSNATKTSGALGLDTTNGNLTQWTAFTTTNLGSALGITKLGANTLTLNSPNTYAGATTISGGTLALGAVNVLPNASAVSIGAATLHAATAGTEVVGTLAVTAAASINLAAGAKIEFNASSGIPWPGTLNLTGTFVSGSSLRFGNSGGLTATQLGKISALGFTGFGLTVDGFLTATTVPTYTITNTTTDANGTCTPAGITTVADGGSQTYSLTPNADHAVATLTVNGAPVTPALSYTFTNVTENQTIHATFVNISTATLHWDSNSSTPGFGNTTGTWGTNQFWTIDASGSSVPLPITTTPSSSVHFGSATLNYNNSAVAVAAGGVNAGNITFGTGQSTALTLSGGAITLGDAAVITVNNSSNTIDSVLTGAGSSLTKAGTGSLTLSAPNTYSGTTAITAGTLRLGASNVLPDGLGVGNVDVTGTLDLNTFSETLNGLSGAGTVDTVAGGNPILTVGGADAASTFSGTITDTTGTLALNKTGSGTLILSGTNGYSGPTTLTGGTLQIGSGGTTGSIDNTTGVTNDAALIFNRSNNLTVAYDIGGSGTLIKQGAGILTLSGNNSYTGQTSISAGTLRLTNTAAVQNSALVSVSSNTLQIATSAGITASGNVSINGGTITLNQPSPAPGLSHAFEQLAFTHNGTPHTFTSSNVTDGNATLTFANATVRSGSGGTGTLNPTGVNLIIGTFEGGNTGTSNLVLGGTTILNRIDGAIENGARTTQNVLKSNTGTWTLSGDNDYTGNTTITQGTLRVGAPGAIPSGAGKGNVVFNNSANTAVLDLNGSDVTLNGLTQATPSTTNRVVNNAAATLSTLTVGDNDATSTFAGILADHTGTGGTLALTKTGSGTLTLSGANTYTGNTTVNAGTLVLADNAQLKFVIGATSGTNNRITGAGTVTLDGDFNIDTNLTDASTLTSGSWTIANGATFNSTFTLIGAGWSETDNVWTTSVGSKTYTFTEATGILAMSSTAPDTTYVSWAAANASSTTPAQDQDNDGVSNAVEYVLGGDALTNDLSKLPTISASGENVLFSFKRIQTSINVSTAVRIQVGTTLHSWPGSHTVGADTASSSANVTVLNGVPAGFDTVTLSIPRAPDSQKFVRLQVTITP